MQQWIASERQNEAVELWSTLEVALQKDVRMCRCAESKDKLENQGLCWTFVFEKAAF